MTRRFIGLLLIVLALPLAVLAQDMEFSGYLDNKTTSLDFTLPLNEGDSVLIATEALDGDLDTVLQLISPDGKIEAENDDRAHDTLDSAIGFTAETSGAYIVRVSRYGGSDTSGNFNLTITVGGETVLDELDNITRVRLSGDELTRDTEHFRIHYTLEGDDAATEQYVTALALSMEEIWRLQIDRMGWPPPPSDNGRGGNTLYDVYLSDLVGQGDHALGYTVPEDIRGDDPNTPDLEENAMSSYIVLENDMDLNFLNRQEVTSLMRTTMSHEFNHAVQFGYDANDHHWYYEATATWMETAALVKDEDASGYVEYVFKYPELCFGSDEDDEVDGLGVYGMWLFIQALADRHGEEAVQLLWENIATYDGFESLEQTLAAYDDDLLSMVAGYHVQNLVREYELAPVFYATVWLENTIDDVGRWTYRGEGIQELAANYFKVDLQPGTYYAGMMNDGGMMDLWAVGVRGAEADAIPLGRGGNFDTTGYDHFYFVVFNPTYDENPSGCQYYDYSVDIVAGKGEPNPVLRVFDANNFIPLN